MCMHIYIHSYINEHMCIIHVYTYNYTHTYAYMPAIQARCLAKPPSLQRGSFLFCKCSVMWLVWGGAFRDKPAVDPLPLLTTSFRISRIYDVLSY